MKKEGSRIKQIVAFLFTALAGLLGHAEAPELFVSFGSVLGAVYVITNLLKRFVHRPWIQVASWLVGILISLAGWYLQLGVFEDMTWMFALVTGFMVSLAANGIYDTQLLEAAWRKITSRGSD